MPKIIVSKTVYFDAAHHLPGYDGPCKRIHGHTWKVRVGISGPVDSKTGMVLDFKDLKKMLEEEVVDRFDHQDLNTFFPNPTAENIARAIFEGIKNDWMPGWRGELEWVKVWESPDSCCEVRE